MILNQSKLRNSGREGFQISEILFGELAQNFTVDSVYRESCSALTQHQMQFTPRWLSIRGMPFRKEKAPYVNFYADLFVFR
jgi:hypothetical protein